MVLMEMKRSYKGEMRKLTVGAEEGASGATSTGMRALLAMLRIVSWR
jgi:hypothetical protein